MGMLVDRLQDTNLHDRACQLPFEQIWLVDGVAFYKIRIIGLGVVGGLSAGAELTLDRAMLHWHCTHAALMSAGKAVKTPLTSSTQAPALGKCSKTQHRPPISCRSAGGPAGGGGRRDLWGANLMLTAQCMC